MTGAELPRQLGGVGDAPPFDERRQRRRVAATQVVGDARQAAGGDEGAVASLGLEQPVQRRARHAGPATSVVARTEAGGWAALAPAHDVAAKVDAIVAVEATVVRFGRLDILVDAAGVIQGGGVESLPVEEWRRVFDLNLFGTLHACKAAVPRMKRRGSGDIVDIPSTAGRRAAGCSAPVRPASSA